MQCSSFVRYHVAINTTALIWYWDQGGYPPYDLMLIRYYELFEFGCCIAYLYTLCMSDEILTEVHHCWRDIHIHINWPITCRNFAVQDFTFNRQSDTFISSPHSATYMCEWTGSSLVEVIACRLFGAKPLSVAMLAYCQLDSGKQIIVRFESEIKCNWKCRLLKWRPFCPGGDGLRTLT